MEGPIMRAEVESILTICQDLQILGAAIVRISLNLRDPAETAMVLLSLNLQGRLIIPQMKG